MTCLLLAANACAGGALREISTRHYTVHTDITDRDLVSDLTYRLDAMYDEYARRLVDFRPRANGARYNVYLFQHQDDYHRFTRSSFNNSGGVFLPHANALAAFLDGQGREALRRTLQHEAFHQFAHDAIQPDMPIWLNEGLAQLFEEAIWIDGRYQLNEVPPRRVRHLHQDMRAARLVPFDRFLSVGHETWNEGLVGDVDQGGTQYNQAWAMVHFLVNAEDPTGKPLYRERLIKMLRLLKAGTPGDSAFQQCFGGNYDNFEARFTDWARKLQPTPVANIIERQEVLADMLRSATDAGIKYNSFAAFKKQMVEGSYRIEYVRGRIRWTSDRDSSIYFKDLAGREFTSDELYFETRRGAPLPDIVCRPGNSARLRTRFHRHGDIIEHELMIETR